MNNIKKIIENNYLINIFEIEKSAESTVGNVYIIYTSNKKYILKIYEDLNHTESIILLHKDLSNNFNIPNIVSTKDGNSYVNEDKKYYVLFSFLEGIQIGRLDKLDSNIIKYIALELRKIHDLTSTNKYKLDETDLCEDYNIKRKSLLHFDLTKGNIFYNLEKDSIGFIDFDDAKYGESICDVSILIALLFISKKRGIDNDNIKLFIDTYYSDDFKLKNEEIKYIKEISTKWINLTLENNEFNPSTKESFEVKKKLIEENLNFIELIP